MNAFMDNVTRRDWGILLAIIVLTSVSAYVVDTAVKGADTEEAGMEITAIADMGTVVLMTVMLVAAIIVSYLCIRVYGGSVGKGFYMFIWGFIFQLALPIEIAWHLMNLPNMVGQPWLGIPSYWWLGFFHASIAVSIALMGYGLYILVHDLENV